MDSKEIIVFRHGETEWNRIKRLQGHSDIPLNETGREQALTLQKLLASYKPEVILTSDLLRALETAKIASQTIQCNIHATSALRECHMGESEGMFRDTLLEKFGQQSWDRWLSAHEDDQNFSFPGGETKQQHLQRMLEHIEPFVAQNNQYRRIAISTHGGSLYRLIHHCKNAPKTNLIVSNCALFRFQLNVLSREWTFLEQVESREPPLSPPVPLSESR